MRAAVYHDRRDVRVEDVDEPSGPAEGEVLVAPLWCGICGTDVHEYTDGPIVTPVDPHPLTGATNPQVLGHEFSAEILEVGVGVTNVKAGDRASVMPLIYCGHCHYCRLGQHHLCATMACTGLSHRWGGLAEAAIVSAGQLTRIPDEIDDRQGALVEPIAVAACGVDRAGVGPGSTVLVTGAGPIGMLTAEYAIARGATTVIVSEPNAGRRSIAEALGVQATLDPTAVDVVEAVRELTGGLGVDAAVECSGSAAALDAASRRPSRSASWRRPGCTSARRRSTRSSSRCTRSRSSERGATRSPTGRGSSPCWHQGGWTVASAVTSTLGLDSTVDGFERLIDREGSDVKILINPRA